MPSIYKGKWYASSRYRLFGVSRHWTSSFLYWFGAVTVAFRREQPHWREKVPLWLIGNCCRLPRILRLEALFFLVPICFALCYIVCGDIREWKLVHCKRVLDESAHICMLRPEGWRNHLALGLQYSLLESQAVISVFSLFYKIND